MGKIIKLINDQLINILYTASLISREHVIPAKAGIQENTGFPRIKYGAGLVKPGMTEKEKTSVVVYNLLTRLL